MAIKEVIEIVTRLQKIAEKTKNADLRLEVANLQLALADTKTENAELKNKVLELEKQLKAPGSTEGIIYEGNLVYIKTGDGARKGPYCPNCFENKKEKYILTDNTGTPFERIAKFNCTNCDGIFN